MSEWAIRTLRRVASDLRLFEDGRFTQDVVDAFVTNLELVYRELIAQEHINGLDASGCEACELVRCLQFLRTLQDETTQMANQAHTPPVLRTGCAGRPRFDIPREQMAFLVDSRFTGPQMADILGVSVSTVRRRMSDFGISIRAEYASLTNAELDDVVEDIHRDFPMCENQQMQGHLVSRGYRIQQQSIREAQRRVDPVGSVMRRLRAVHRRRYQVPTVALKVAPIDDRHVTTTKRRSPTDERRSPTVERQLPTTKGRTKQRSSCDDH